MHVLHLYDGHEQVYEGRGSVPNVVWHLARETAARGHDVTVLERQWDGLAPHATHEGVGFERIPLRTGADEPWERVPYEQVSSPVGLGQLAVDRTHFALRALRRLRGRSVDVLHVHLPFAASVLVTVAPSLRERTVYTTHLGELRLDALTEDQRGAGGDAAEASTNDFPASVEVDGGTDGVGDEGGETANDGGVLEAPTVLSAASPDVYLADRVAHTTVLNERIVDAFSDRGIDRERLSVLPNGVDLDRFTNVSLSEQARVREAYGLDDAPVVLFVGTLMPRKGILDLVRAAGIVAEELATDRSPPFHLVLAGEDDLDGGYVEQVQTAAAELGLADVVSLPGFVPAEDLPSLYAAADLFVLPSLEEGFGMTVIEALATGTPVVGTRVGAVAEIVDEGEHGYVVEPGDFEGFADALGRLIGDEDIRSAMAANGPERAGDYSWPSIGDRCEAVYRTVVD